MSSFVYLLSSLPTLDIVTILNSENDVYKGVMVPTTEEFLNLCDRNLEPNSAQKIKDALENPSNSMLGMVHQLMQYLGAVQDLIAQKRWAILGPKYVRKSDTKNENVGNDPWQGVYPQMFVNDSVPVSADASDIVAQAIEKNNPLEREIHVIKSLWSFLDHLDSQYQHSIENLIIYGYKIKLYQRLVSFNYRDGDIKWNTLIKEFSEKAGFSPHSITGPITGTITGTITKKNGTNITKELNINKNEKMEALGG